MPKRGLREIRTLLLKPEPKALDVLNEALDALEMRHATSYQREEQEAKQDWDNRSEELVRKLCVALTDTLSQLDLFLSSKNDTWDRER